MGFGPLSAPSLPQVVERVCSEMGCGGIHPVLPNSLKLTTDKMWCPFCPLQESREKVEMYLPFYSPAHASGAVLLCLWGCVSECGICVPRGLQSALYMRTVRCQNSLTPDLSHFTAGWLLSHHPAFSGQPSRSIFFSFCQKLIQNWPVLWGNALIAGWSVNENSLSGGQFEPFGHLKMYIT